MVFGYFSRPESSKNTNVLAYATRPFQMRHCEPPKVFEHKPKNILRHIPQKSTKKGSKEKRQVLKVSRATCFLPSGKKKKKLVG